MDDKTSSAVAAQLARIQSDFQAARAANAVAMDRALLDLKEGFIQLRLLAESVALDACLAQGITLSAAAAHPMQFVDEYRLFIREAKAAILNSALIVRTRAGGVANSALRHYCHAPDTLKTIDEIAPGARIYAQVDEARVWLESIGWPIPAILGSRHQASPPAPSPSGAEPTFGQKAPAQDQAILTYLRSQSLEPTSLPRAPNGKAGIKAETRAAMLKRSELFSDSSFKKAWERLSAAGEIKFSD